MSELHPNQARLFWGDLAWNGNSVGMVSAIGKQAVEVSVELIDETEPEKGFKWKDGCAPDERAA